jgi:iron complex outermembrane receptor protein
MNKFLGTLSVLLLITVTAQAQFAVKGRVTDTRHQPLAGATVTFSTPGKKKWSQVTEPSGVFSFTLDKGVYRVQIQSVGKKTISETLEIPSGSDTLQWVMEDIQYLLEPLEVKAVRASEKAPFTKTNLSKEQITQNNLGQDLPFLLNQTPSVVVNSDAGNGVGYTGVRIRGSDATRINVTLNGIPYNDAESLGSFFVDIPDIASSASSIQIQRGVGTSTNGAGAFGATLNLSTNEFISQPYAESNNSYGSFNTWKNTVKAGSGLIGDHFTIDARLSRISSDGYIDRASTLVQSLYLSTAYISNKTSLRFNLISGKEKTYQAWNGVPQDSLATHRTYNSCGTEKPGTPYDNQTDNYIQTHYQLFLNQSLGRNWTLNIASFLTRGKGYYEEYKAAQAYSAYGLPDFITGRDTFTTTDLVRQRWLDNYYYGQTFSVQYKKNRDEITFGGGWTKYDGKHYGNIIWTSQGGIPKDQQYYYFPATKTDQHVYAKWQHDISNNWSLFGDIQYRHVMHEMNGFEDAPTLYVKRKFDFINPKAGISYNHNGWNAYLSYALGHKEPNRDDFQASPAQQPKREALHDMELGFGKKAGSYNWSATVYYMRYQDQLVLTGALNDVGSPIRVNVPHSYRAGLELQGGVRLASWLNAAGNLALSRNKIKDFTEYLTEYDADFNVVGQQAIKHHQTDISYSPAIVGGATLNFIPARFAELSLISKYVSRQYMDNTQNRQRSISDFYTQDARLTLTLPRWVFKQWTIIGQVNNVFNRMYEPGGSTYPYILAGATVNDNYYTPMAGTNFMVALNVRF